MNEEGEEKWENILFSSLDIGKRFAVYLPMLAYGIGEVTPEDGKCWIGYFERKLMELFKPKNIVSVCL